MTRWHWCGLALGGLLLGLAACTTPPNDGNFDPNAGRYTQSADGAPLRPLKPDDVEDAIPRADPILAAGNTSPYMINGIRYEVLADSRNYREQGIASWYGTKFHGHATANGEVYDLYAPSAAHRTLPIPSYARVVNLDNGRSVVVRVNDRGPFHDDRIIDLSYAAAVKLGYANAGTARVEVESLNIAGVDDRRDNASGDYRFLQLGAFVTQAAAATLQVELLTWLDATVFVAPVDAGGRLLYRVRIGPLGSADELQAVQAQLSDRGYDAGQPLP
ncbi:MAG: septal ring lytic transglycosylase RlpA family protein [Pseudomonadota bacterium]